jgi:hypothetical protein
LEVLFAILVTTIGLFGALALLPVASSQARKGRLNDAVAVAAMTCVHEFDARGMRRPVPLAGQPGGWMGWNPLANSGNGAFTAGVPTFGKSYCIDPRCVAENGGTAARANAFRIFPYVPTATGAPRMDRITLWSGLVNAGQPVPMNKLRSDAMFTIDDDLTYDRSDDNSLAPTQQFDTLPSALTTNARRRTDGHMSWLATLVPKLDRYTINTTDVLTSTYVLSIVVFYDRPANLGYDQGAASTDSRNERIVTVASFPASEIGGREIQLTASSAAALDLKANDWIMLSGLAPHALGGNFEVFKWYRVLDTEAEATDDDNDGTYERYVTLGGPDWDLPPSNTEAVIVEGVVGVYEKTIRLE